MANWYIGCDNVITLTGLYDTIEAAYVNNATITADLEAVAAPGVPIVGALAIAYVATSDGNYRGIIPAATALAARTFYTLIVTIVIGATTLTYKVTRKAIYYTFA